MKLLISGVSDELWQSFRRKTLKLSLEEKRRVTQSMLLERMFKELYPNDLFKDEDDKLDIFDTEEDE